jgi:hypothetical protein
MALAAPGLDAGDQHLHDHGSFFGRYAYTG